MFSDFFIDFQITSWNLSHNLIHIIFYLRVVCVGLVSARPSTKISEMFYLHFERALESTSKQVWDEWEKT